MDNVDAAIVILSPQAMTDVLETAEIVPRVTENIDKPVLCAFMGIVDVSEGSKYLEAHGIPDYSFPEDAVKAMGSMVKFGDLLRLEKREVRRVAADRESATKIIKRRLEGKESYMMPQSEANEVLACYGFPLLRSACIKDPSEIHEAAQSIGYPVVMKISSPDISHKFDAGGVILKIKSDEEAKKAFDTIIENAKNYKPDAYIKGILMEQMARKGVEVILGSTHDPRFGPICMFGLGGTLVEAIKDVTFRVAPMWEISAEKMISSIKTYKVLQGVRGMPRSDMDAIKDCILRLSQMVTEQPLITELDINPLIVYPEGEGCVVADSRILVQSEPACSFLCEDE